MVVGGVTDIEAAFCVNGGDGELEGAGVGLGCHVSGDDRIPPLGAAVGCQPFEGAVDFGADASGDEAEMADTSFAQAGGQGLREEHGFAVDEAGGVGQVARRVSETPGHFLGSPVVFVVEVADQFVIELGAGGKAARTHSLPPWPRRLASRESSAHSALLRVASGVPCHSRKRAVVSVASR